MEEQQPPRWVEITFEDAWLEAESDEGINRVLHSRQVEMVPNTGGLLAEEHEEGPNRINRALMRAALRRTNELALQSTEVIVPPPTYNTEENCQEEGDCSICLESYKSCKIVKCSKCKPLNHLTCVEKGGLRKCPVCRTPY